LNGWRRFPAGEAPPFLHRLLLPHQRTGEMGAATAQVEVLVKADGGLDHVRMAEGTVRLDGPEELRSQLADRVPDFTLVHARFPLSSVQNGPRCHHLKSLLSLPDPEHLLFVQDGGFPAGRCRSCGRPKRDPGPRRPTLAMEPRRALAAPHAALRVHPEKEGSAWPGTSWSLPRTGSALRSWT